MILRSIGRGLMIFTLVILLVILHRSRFLISLLFENGAEDAIYSSAILSEPNMNTTQLIPKIIHQTYKTEDIPSHWREGQQSVKDLHPDWEYKFWTDAQAQSFIQTHYPSFLITYYSYTRPIQRADAVRYFLLYHYGGIYLDLDIHLYRPLTPLLQFPAVACLTSPTGISNDVLGSVPGHPFYKLVTDSLEEYARKWISGYLTVMYSTGPLFLSALWVQYRRDARTVIGKAREMGRVKVLVQGATKGDSYGFFKNTQGGSWHEKDAVIIFWIGRNWMYVTILGFMLTFAVISIYRRNLSPFVGRRYEGRARWYAPFVMRQRMNTLNSSSDS